MQLRKIKDNCHVLETPKGEFLFSYETLVAFRLKGIPMATVTNKKWSASTTRHINEWLGSTPSIPIEQTSLDNLIL